MQKCQHHAELEKGIWQEDIIAVVGEVCERGNVESILTLEAGKILLAVHGQQIDSGQSPFHSYPE